jgi:membrane protein DedA with SNARE-associated domain
VLILGLHLHLHLLHHVKGPALDYVGVAVAAFASWAGLPGPGEGVLLAASIVAAKHKLDLTPVLAVAWAGATAGGITGWAVGLKAGRRVLTAPGPFRSIRLDAVEKGERAFKRMQALAIVLTPSWVAGIYSASTGIYMLVNALSALAWAVAIGVGGYYAGPPVLELVNDFGTLGTIVAVALVVGAVAVTVLRRQRAATKRRASRQTAS